MPKKNINEIRIINAQNLLVNFKILGFFDKWGAIDKVVILVSFMLYKDHSRQVLWNLTIFCWSECLKGDHNPLDHILGFWGFTFGTTWKGVYVKIRITRVPLSRIPNLFDEIRMLKASNIPVKENSVKLEFIVTFFVFLP